MSITPIDVSVPLWAGTWLGVFPTVETLAGQLGSLTFVIGSYYLAGWVSKRRSRPARPQPAATVPTAASSQEGLVSSSRR